MFSKFMTKLTVVTTVVSTMLAGTMTVSAAEIAPVTTEVGGWAVTALAKDAGTGRIEAFKVTGSLAAWTETDGAKRTIYVFDGTQIRSLATFDKSDWADDGNGFYDAINGNFDVADNLVVWTMSDGKDREIYQWDGDAVKRVSDNTYDDRHPITSAGRIVWTSQPSAVYNLMVKDRFGMRRLDSWHVLNYAFSGANLFWLNKLPGENWFRVFVNGGLVNSPVGQADDRALTKYFFVDGNGSVAWEYSTKRWDYDKRVTYVSMFGGPAVQVIQRDVPPMVTRIEDMNNGTVALNVTDLLYTRLTEKASLMMVSGGLEKTVFRKASPSKVRFMDGGYVRHREPDANTPLVFRAADHEDFVTLDAVILDRFDADGTAAAGARVGGGLIAFDGTTPVVIPSTVETTEIAVKDGSIAWVEGTSGAKSLKVATKTVLVRAAQGPETYTGRLVKATNASTVYFAAADGKRYVFGDEATFKSWFADFDSVQTLSAQAISVMPVGGKVLLKPGTGLVRAASSPRVYAIAKDGSAHWIVNPQLVEQYFGSYWKTQVTTIDDASFADYAYGAPINNSTSYAVAMSYLK